MPANTTSSREIDLSFVALKGERKAWLLDLIHTARREMAPRNFVERHLVDEMAVAKWRGMRTVMMERSVYEHQAATFHPEDYRAADGTPLPDAQDIFHTAMAHAADQHAVALAALSRLDDRFQRQFCSALRHFLALRRMNPFNPPASPPKRTTKAPATPANTNKQEDPTPCTPSPSQA